MSQRHDGRGGARCRTLYSCPVSTPKVLLSTTAVFPEATSDAFVLAAELGYDGVELRLSTLSREPTVGLNPRTLGS